MPAVTANVLRLDAVRPSDWRRAARIAFQGDPDAIKVCQFLASHYNAKIRLSVPSSATAIGIATGLSHRLVCKILARLERAGAITQLEFADPPVAIRRLCPPGQGAVQVARLITNWAAGVLNQPREVRT
ncbi:hypothetical protein [Mesorhizobium sp. Mes31]|uniref:hypothetical protein n=1 Tax=Mesorhizobium sp. Mes31 TaxID=2926017 RepID=UPI002118C87C|nr:hypothetical protein [Mesorhizobium sp. Mes31]